MFKFNLQTGEKIAQMHRQAEIILVKPVITVFIAIFVPWWFLIKYELHIKFERVLLLWTIIVLIYAVNKYVLWLINVYIITNKRLIAVNYKSLVHKQVLETPFERIHNISYETKGFWRSLLQVGSVIVQIASLQRPLVLKNLKHPDQFKDTLWNRHMQNGQGNQSGGRTV